MIYVNHTHWIETESMGAKTQRIPSTYLNTFPLVDGHGTSSTDKDLMPRLSDPRTSDLPITHSLYLNFNLVMYHMASFPLSEVQ